MLRTFCLCLIASIAHVLPAQLDFVAIDIVPSLDELYYVDMNAPATASGATIATLSGNFIRGMDLTAETTGWYVATSSLSGSPTGIYRLDDGVSTQVAPLPFTSTSVGGLSFSAAEDFLYYVIDPPIGDDTLYQIDFNGNVTPLAPITYVTAGPVAIVGIAVDPLTGVLYAVDNGTDSLYTIDPGTGFATLVGPLGVSFSGVGGLDFSLDGTNRLFFVGGSACYEVNPATGAAGPSLGNMVSGSSSSLAAIPSRVTMNMTTLAIGQPFFATLSGGNSGDGFAMLASLGGAYVPFPPFGVARIDISTVLEFANGALDGVGAASFGAVLPSDPGLLNLTIHFQSYVVSGLTTPGVKATNNVIRVIQ